jgi:hypothetical protein
MDPESEDQQGAEDGKALDLLSRRNLLVAAGRWSKAAIACALGAGLLAEGEPEAKAGYGTWVNRRGGWVNGAAAWVNRSGGWINGGATWVNRSGGWLNGGGGGGGWLNGRGGGGAGWVNGRGGGGGSWVNRRG